MKLLPQSNPARRIILSGVIVVLLLAVLYGGFRWRVYRQQQLIDEFVRTTSLENNPWGVEYGMDNSELRAQFAEAQLGTTYALSLLDMTSNYGIAHEGVWYQMEVSIQFIPSQSRTGLTKLCVISGEKIDPSWLTWLKSLLTF